MSKLEAVFLFTREMNEFLLLEKEISFFLLTYAIFSYLCD